MPTILVSVKQNKIEIDPARIRRAAEEILNALGYTDSELSVVIVDDTEMAQLNKQYRDQDASTDVLSFSMLEGEFAGIHPEMLGDVVISAPMASEMSREHGCSFSAVIDLLLIHGLLHLIGYNHQKEEPEARIMEAKTIELLHKLGHSDRDFSWYVNPSA